MRIAVSDDGHLVTYPLTNSVLTESEGDTPVEFDRYIEVSDESGSTVEIDDPDDLAISEREPRQEGVQRSFIRGGPGSLG
jgi:hypothetical protein